MPFANPSRAVSTFVWLLALSYLYLELTTDERAMGVFILPIVVGLQIDSRDLSGHGIRAIPVLDSPWFWVHVVVAAVRVRQLRAGRRARADLHAAVQGDQEEAPRLLLHAAAVAADARRDELARGAVGWLFLTIGVVVGVVWTAQARAAVARRPEPAGDVAQRSEDLHRAC